MSLRFSSFLALAVLCFVQIVDTGANAPALINQEKPEIYIDFNACVSYFNGYNEDYSEFTGVETINPSCTAMSLVGGHVYRINPEVNTHSCTPGVEDRAMCISGSESCTFLPGNERALRFDVLLVPGSDGVGSLEEIAFFSQAPEDFVFLDGMTGPNNYPQLMALRVTANGSEVFREEDIMTSRTWTESVFDFSANPAFRVDVPTLFSFEILPYCLAGIDSEVQAWDIDELYIRGGCNDINGGIISIDSSATICYPDSQNLTTTRVFSVDMEIGSNFSWIIANQTGEIVNLTGSGSFDFNALDNGIYSVYHIAYDSTDIQGLVRGGLVENILGCFDLSNEIQVFNNKLEPGVLSSNGQDSVLVCSSDSLMNVIEVTLTDAVGLFTHYFLLDSDSTILDVSDQPIVELNSYGEGTYYIVAVSHNGEMFNAVVGMELDMLSGCFVLSNSVFVQKSLIDGGMISFDGADDFQACETSSFLLEPLLEDTIGGTSRWILYIPSGLIVSVYDSTPIDISMMLMPSLRLVHISYLEIDGLQAGQNINNLTGCFDLSNVLSIDIPTVDGGVISTNGVDSINICLNDPLEAEVVVDTEDVEGTAFSLFVTDESGEILMIPNTDTIDFSSAGQGTCFIWNIAFVNMLDGFEIGMNVDSIVGCYDLSNSIAVNRVELVPAELSANNGMTSFEICSGDGISDSLVFTASNFTGPFTNLVVTDAMNNILEVPESDTIDFEGVVEGLCLVYHLVSTNDSILDGMPANIDSLSGCYALSNPVSVLRNEVDGGMLMTVDSLTEVFIVIGDGSSTEVDVIIENSIGDSSAWVITDTLGNIIDLPGAPPFDFANAGPGVCLIWYLSYNGDIQGLQIDQNAGDLEGCFDLSNPITVNRVTLNGGILEFDDGTDTMMICTGDSMIDSLDVVLSDEEGPLFSWLVTDTSGLILDITDNPPFIFDDTPGGICLIWHIAYTDELEGLEVDNNVSDLTGSFNLSNALTVIRMFVDGGSIITTDSLTSISTCTGDGIADSIDIILDTFSGDSTAWVITDTAGVILELPSGPPFDFEGVDPGTCLIYHLAFFDELDNLEVDSNINMLVGCYDLSNSIEISRFEVDGGIISEASGLDTLEVIVGEGVIDSFEFSVIDASGDSLMWVVTDSSGIILSVSDTPPIEFENGGAGVCQVYHIAYGSDDIGLIPGADITSLQGCYDLSNSITVERTAVNGGVIMTLDSLDFIDLCIQEGMHMPVEIIIDGIEGDTFQWVVTDTAGVILELPSGPPFDFSGAASGTCQLWHLAYIGTISNLAVGSNVADITGIFNFSNAIQINKTQVNGGVLSHMSGSDTLSFITNDGLSDLVDLDLADAEGDSIHWVITDESGIITALPDTLPFDFEGSDAGICLIWNIAYDSLPGSLVVDSSALNLEGCFDLSNAITVIKEEINGGVILTPDSTTVVSLCLNDTISDIVNVMLSDTFGMNYSWLITDLTGLILELPAGPPFDFSDAPDGICQIWHLAYQDNLMGLAEGNDISDLTGSFDFSNPVEVLRDSLSGGNLTLEDGSVSDTITVGDGIIDTITLVLSGQMADNFIYLVTDTLGNIIDTTSLNEIDLESAGGGVCQIWNLSYSNGLLGLEIGNNVSDLDGCLELSNPVTIVKEGLMGGVLSAADGSTEAAVCLSDTISDDLDFILEGASGPVFSWVVTDTAGLILDLPGGLPINVTGLGVELCQVWNLTHEVMIMGLAIGNNVSDLEGNFDLSNPVNVEINDNQGSSIMTTDSLLSVTITVGEGIIDTIDVILEGGQGDTSVWVITDTLGNIMELPDAPPFDFESAGGGVCQIWHLNYSFGLSGLELDANVSDLEGCFEFSNPIEVIRIPTELNGGFLTTVNFLTSLEICVGNGNTPLIDVILNNNAGPNFQWVISDTSGLILGLPNDPPFDLSLAGPGLCQIWNISFSNGLEGLEVGENIDSLDGFFDFSNPINVTRNQADGGTILTPNGFIEVTIPVGEGVVDSVDVILTSEDGEFQQWIITDTDFNLLDVTSMPPFTFEEEGGGTCIIWSISYSGPLMGLQVGNNLADIEGCFDLSNSLTVNKDGVNGGFLTDSDGSVVSDFCFTDAFTDSLELVLSDTIGMFYQLIVADTDGVIIDLPASAPIDLNGLPTGTCFVYNVAYDMLPMGLVTGDTLTNLSGNFHLSNALAVNKAETFGGNLTFGDGSILDSIEVGEGVVDTIEVILTDSLGTVNQWVVTDTFGFITDLPPSDPFNFESAGGGVCQIWNIAFEPGLQGLEVGNPVSGLSGCFSFSNPVTLVKDGVNGGLLSYDDMTFEREICLGDGIADLTTFVVQGPQGANQELLITQTNGQLFSIDIPNPFNFEVIPINIDSFIIYNIAFDTMPAGYAQGSFLGNLSGNFDLSNPVLMVRDIQKGGSIVDQNGGIDTTLIVGDGIVDTLTMELTGAFADSLTWVIANENDTIVSFQDSNQFVIDSSGSAVCHIYHMGFDPNGISGLAVGQPIDSLVGCYGLSNRYTLTKKALNGGMLTTTTGETSIELCLGDGNPDIVNVITEGELGAQFVFIVVSPSGIILSNQTSSQIDLSSVQPGECQIFNLAHDGSLMGLMNGVNIVNLAGCYVLSNPIDVTKNGVFGGNLSFQSGGTEMDVCVNDAIADNLIWETTSAVSADYAYAITDTFNVIDTILMSGTFDFNDSELGVCRIWGISYIGTLVAAQGDTVGVDVLVEDCFDISNDFLTVNKIDCSQPAVLEYGLFPNPVSDILSVDISQMPREVADCIIFDSKGKVMHRTRLTKGRDTFDVTALDNGIYYISIKSGAHIKTERFVILR